ncbi:MAG: 50S ribosomal protein L23 [bacterium]|nr:50S ribosomal protein L23 [bacterium]
MAIFGTKKNKEVSASTKVTADKKAKAVKAVKAAKAPAEKKTKAVSTGTEVFPGNGAIIRPRITEKSGMLSQIGVYTFEVEKNATKASISRAVVGLYKVTPVKVAIINLPDRKIVMRGRRGVIPGVRKALVTVKKGDKIEFV